MTAAQYDPADPWHAAVNLMLTVDCDTGSATFVSPTLGHVAAAGGDAAVVAGEAKSAGWRLIGVSRFRCSTCLRSDTE